MVQILGGTCKQPAQPLKPEGVWYPATPDALQKRQGHRTLDVLLKLHTFDLKDLQDKYENILINQLTETF